MTDKERLIALTQASEDTLRMVDEVLKGGVNVVRNTVTNCKLITITEACKQLNVSYQRMNRILEDDLLDIIPINGRRMIRQESLDELSRGERRPSAEAVARRAEINAKRRELYKTNKKLMEM